VAGPALQRRNGKRPCCRAHRRGDRAGRHEDCGHWPPGAAGLAGTRRDLGPGPERAPSWASAGGWSSAPAEAPAAGACPVRAPGRDRPRAGPAVRCATMVPVPLGAHRRLLTAVSGRPLESAVPGVLTCRTDDLQAAMSPEEPVLLAAHRSRHLWAGMRYRRLRDRRARGPSRHNVLVSGVPVGRSGSWRRLASRSTSTARGSRSLAS
jgi:hypothetical protein